MEETKEKMHLLYPGHLEYEQNYRKVNGSISKKERKKKRILLSVSTKVVCLHVIIKGP